MTDDLPDQYITVREAARRLECHENTIRNWAKDGTIKVWARGESGFLRIPISEVERILAERPEVELTPPVLVEARYRPIKIQSACEPCRAGECWDCQEVVVHPGNRRLEPGTTITCVCLVGAHQWKPWPVFPRNSNG